MPKEIYLYSAIYDFIAQDIISSIEENIGGDITLRANTPGGSVFSAYGIYQKIKEHGNVNLKVDGAAMSCGALLPLYAKYTECLDVSRFLFHRADMYVANENDQTFLDNINKDLKAQIKKKIDADTFKEVTGYTIEELFNPEKRIDITLTGAEAKKIGLVDKVVKLTPEMEHELTAFHNRYKVAANATTLPQTHKKSNNKMDINQLKTDHPAVFAEAVALGEKQGIEKEKIRVKAFMAFASIDAEGVNKAIMDGTEFTVAHVADFGAKAATKSTPAAVVTEAPAAVVTANNPETVQTEEQKNVTAFMSEVKSYLNK